MYLYPSQKKKFLCVHMKDGGNIELPVVVQNAPKVQKKAVVIYVQGLILLILCKCTGLHVYMFNNGTSYYAMEFVLARFLSFSPM